MNNNFFKPTLLHKEYMILDMIEKNSKIKQREMSRIIGISVSLVNDYLDTYEKDKLIIRKKHSKKTVEYFITKNGSERRKLLNIWYLKSSHRIYISAKENIFNFLNQIVRRGFKNILIYGAGEVTEIMLQVIKEKKNLPLKILALIDDDPSKINKEIENLPIIEKEDIKLHVHDGILIPSYKHHKEINKKLMMLKYPSKKIINFFDN